MVRVFVCSACGPEALQEVRRLWLAHGAGEVVVVPSPDRAIHAPPLTGERRVVDLLSVGSGESIAEALGAAKRQGTSPGWCSFALSFRGFLSAHGVPSAVWPPHTRIYVYNELVYTPAFLEMKRLLRERTLGELAGGALRRRTLRPEGSIHEDVDAVRWLLHGPVSAVCDSDGMHAVVRGPSGPVGLSVARPRRVPWDVAAGPKIVSGADELILRLRFDRGTLTACLPSGPWIRVCVDGESSYPVPLPEGDGLFYFTMDVVQCARRGSSSWIYPAELAGTAAARASGNAG